MEVGPAIRRCCGLLLALGGCGEGGAAGPDLHQVEARLAWMGEDAGGLRVLAEPLTPPAPGTAAVVTEEAMLREQLGLGRDRSLVRLHLVGEPPQLQAPGSLATANGQRFLPFPPPPEHLDARARNLWLGVAQGGPPPDPQASGVRRRSFLLLGENQSAVLPVEQGGGALHWERSGQALPLQPRAWSERERRDFLEQEEREAQEEHEEGAREP